MSLNGAMTYLVFKGFGVGRVWYKTCSLAVEGLRMVGCNKCGEWVGYHMACSVDQCLSEIKNFILSSQFDKDP